MVALTLFLLVQSAPSGLAFSLALLSPRTWDRALVGYGTGDWTPRLRLEFLCYIGIDVLELILVIRAVILGLAHGLAKAPGTANRQAL
jgi:hypothetical protein